jgi:hypothetical protein
LLKGTSIRDGNLSRKWGKVEKGTNNGKQRGLNPAGPGGKEAFLEL